MKSFFGAISSYFEKSYGGRYVSLLISEIAREENVIIESIIGRMFNKSKHEIITELNFLHDRRADIAVNTKSDGKTICLIEIKYDDERNDNIDQLKDYIDFSKKNKSDFVFLTKHYPPTEQIRLVLKNGYRHMLFSDLAKLIRKNKTKSDKLSELFVKYIEEKGLMFNCEIDTKAFNKLLLRFFNPWRGHGKIQCNQDMIETSQKSFSEIMKNIDIISSILTRFIPNSGRKPTIDFSLEPYFNLPKKAVDEFEENASIPLQNKWKRGGILYTYARCAIKQESLKWDDYYLYLSFGYIFKVEKGSSNYTSEIFAEIGSKQLGNDILLKKYKCSNNIVNNEITTLKKISEAIINVIDSALSKESMNCHYRILSNTKDSILQNIQLNSI